MNRPLGNRWLAALALAVSFFPVAGEASPLPIAHVLSVPAAENQLPAPDAAWSAVALPHATTGPAWFRISFEAPSQRTTSWAVYLPYFYGGGSLWLNGKPLSQVESSGLARSVRWERPFLFTVPDSLLQSGNNELLVFASTSPISPKARMPALTLGPAAALLDDYEQRRFWVRTMPQFTVMACLVVGLLVLFIWWRRREELLYGLFGLAAILWGCRTLTFVVETLPTSAWPLWRLFYYSATGGFIVVLLIFALRLAGKARPWVERALFLYWLIGPVAYIASGGSENLLGQVWVGGTIPLGLAILIASAVAAVRQRTWPLVALTVAIALAVAAGVHDYLLATTSPLSQQLAPSWFGHRIFLLHYGADLLLLVMGAILAARFVTALHAVEVLNQTLEARVDERERALKENYAQLHSLEKQHATDEERQRIMRDLHDGLGSQLFVALSQVEAREIEYEGISQVLRECIADMRLALEVMSPEGDNFLDAWGSFRYRWERQLEHAGVRSVWKIEAENNLLLLPPGAGLHVLRIAQEALTNVLKHAAAAQVKVTLSATDNVVCLEVADDGRGADLADRHGRGLANMKTRARRLGGELLTESIQPGTQLRLTFPGKPSATANAA